MPEAVERYLPYIVIVNFILVSALLLTLGKIVTARPLTEVPDGIQNAAELALDWFVDQARRIHPPSVSIIAPFLASLFLLILCSNLLAILPIPILKIPPTSYFSGPLALALIAVLGAIAIGARIRGPWAAARHIFWPNPLQLVAEVSHTMSLSLRLFGNIGGEFLVASLVVQAAPYGIPFVVHALGLIPAAVQPMVFTLLTASFLAAAVSTESMPSGQTNAAQPLNAQELTSTGIARTR
jgi:F-type H+-transporting ATPase subunit a